MSSLTTKSDYRVERLDARNLADVERLHYAVYSKHPARDYFSKKYDTRFAGAQYIGFLAYAGQTPVGFYAVLPCFLDIDDEQILAAQSADTMTHPGHRNKGVFVELALLTFQLCRDSNIRVLFGFPNQNSLPGFIGKLGWNSPASLDYFVISTGRSLWGRLANRLPIAKGLLGRYRKRVLAKYRDAAIVRNSVMGDGFYGIRRDQAWSKYKSYNQTYVIRVEGATLWLKLVGFILIGDIETTPKNFDEMLAGVKKLARLLAIGEIYFYACAGTTLHRLFAGRFKPTLGFPVIFKVLGEDLPVERIKFISADLDIF